MNRLEMLGALYLHDDSLLDDQIHSIDAFERPADGNDGLAHERHIPSLQFSA